MECSAASGRKPPRWISLGQGQGALPGAQATLASIKSGKLKIPGRDPGTGGANKEVISMLKEAVEKWEAKYGKVVAGSLADASTKK